MTYKKLILVIYAIIGGQIGIAQNPIVHIPADTRSAFPVISVHSQVSIQCRWQS